jgi:hypothetical protein
MIEENQNPPVRSSTPSKSKDSDEHAGKSEEMEVIFKYNMSFYYQSTIIYFIVFLAYAIIRGEFIEDSFFLITKDPLIYFFAIVVLYALLSLLYNLYKNRYLEISGDEIAFVDRFKRRSFSFDKIKMIKLFKERKRVKGTAFKLIRIKLVNRRRPVIIRPYDYENQDLLIKRFQELKEKLISK